MAEAWESAPLAIELPAARCQLPGILLNSIRERTVRSFKDLRVWQIGVELSVDCYNATRDFPRSEMFGLTSQIRRAAASVPGNIAEGRGRRGNREFHHFATVALGSLGELETYLIIGHRLEYLAAPVAEALLARTEELSRMLTGLVLTLEKAIAEEDRMKVTRKAGSRKRAAGS